MSFAQVYRKTLRNLNWAADEFGFSWEDPPDETKFKLASELAAIALAHGIRLRMCSQDKYLAEGVTPARCIDSERLSRVAGAFHRWNGSREPSGLCVPCFQRYRRVRIPVRT